MTTKDPMGDRLKAAEQEFAGIRLDPTLPVCARLDGRGFSKWTQGLKRPYDVRLTEIMQQTAGFLVLETNPVIAFTQSDEISLIWDGNADKPESQMIFNGKIQKLTSVLASMATAKFNQLAAWSLPNKPLAFFDCRVWSVPSQVEASNVLLWRAMDARRNSISMLAQDNFSAKELHGKSTKAQLEMLENKGIDWNDYPSSFKYGTYVRRRTYERELSAAEIQNIPEDKRTEPGTKYIRAEVIEVPLPYLLTVKNRTEVIFNDRSPAL